MTDIKRSNTEPEPDKEELQPKMGEPVPGEPVPLNTFSTDVANLLFEKHPEWRQFASSQEGILYVEIPGPVKERALSISTFQQDVTIGLTDSAWHQHFNRDYQATNEAEIAKAMECIRQIIDEELLVAEWRTREDKLCSWGVVPRNVELTPQRGRKIVLSSWTGRYDCEIGPAAVAKRWWRFWLR